MRKARRPKFLDEIPSPLPRGAKRPVREENHFQPPRMYPKGAPVTEERIINAMKACAIVMGSRPDGEIFAPLFERLERELAALKALREPVERARKLLESFTVEEWLSSCHQP